MKRLLILIALLFTVGTASAQLSIDTCLVYGYVYNPDMSPKIEAQIKVNRIIKSGPLWSQSRITFTADSSGYIEMVLPRDCIAYMEGAIHGLSSYPGVGVPLTIPDTNTIPLSSLVVATNVPSTYVVASGIRIERNDTVLVTAAVALDFDRLFMLTQSPAGEVNITLDTSYIATMFNLPAGSGFGGASGVSGSGTANFFPLWTCDTCLGNSNFEQIAGNFRLNGGKIINAAWASNDSDYVTLGQLIDYMATMANRDSINALLTSIQAAVTAADDTAKQANVRSATNESTIASHIANTSNPHGVTPGQIGAPTTTAVEDSIRKNFNGLGYKLDLSAIKAGADGQFLQMSGSSAVWGAAPSGGGGDSAAIHVGDTIGVRVWYDEGVDTLRFRIDYIGWPEVMPDHKQTTGYDSRKRIGWIKMSTVIGGNILRAATSPAQFAFVADSANYVELRYLDIVQKSLEATSLGGGNRCTNWISWNLSLGTEWASKQSCVDAVGQEVQMYPLPPFTRNQMNILASSAAENVTWSRLEMEVGFVISQGQNSTWYVRPVGR